MRNLCLAGGVALNCVANGTILRDGRFDRIWIQPAAGDAGGALGARLRRTTCCCARRGRRCTAATRCRAPSSVRASRRTRSSAGSTAEGAVFDDARRRCADRRVRRATRGGTARSAGSRAHGIRPARARQPLDPRRRALAADAVARSTSRSSSASRSGRSRRRCCARTRRSGSTSTVDSPYMLLVARGRAKRAHRDRSPRPSALVGIAKLKVRAFRRSRDHARRRLGARADRATARRIRAFTRCSRSSRRSPAARSSSTPVSTCAASRWCCTPEDAFRCFMGTDIDVLAFGNCYLRKQAQDTRLARDRRAEFAPD